MKHSRISEGFSSVTLLQLKWCCIVFVFMYSMKDWLFVLLQILSYMVACDRLCELGYDEAQVEEALEMFQNCETKVCIWLFLMCYHKSVSYAHQGCIYLIRKTVKTVKGRMFSVKVGNSFSSHAPIHYGVPQGSILGPLLFALYMLPLGHIQRQFIIPLLCRCHSARLSY